MINKNKILVAAAMMGILGASTIASTASAADDNGHCMGANACKGKGGCKSDANACKGKNGCKGQSFTETTKAKCDKMAKKNPKVHFDAPAAAAAPAKS